VGKHDSFAGGKRRVLLHEKTSIVKSFTSLSQKRRMKGRYPGEKEKYSRSGKRLVRRRRRETIVVLAGHTSGGTIIRRNGSPIGGRVQRELAEDTESRQAAGGPGWRKALFKHESGRSKKTSA